MRLYENMCSPELLGNSASCQRNASSKESDIQHDCSVSSSLSSLQRKPISVFLRDCCPEQGNLHAFIECLNLAHTKGVFWSLIRKRDGVSSLSFKGSQYTWAGGSPHSTGLRHGSPCPGMLQMLRVEPLFFPWEKLSSPFSALCLNFLSCLLSFSLPRAGAAIPAPTQQNIRGMKGVAGHLHGVRPFRDLWN